MSQLFANFEVNKQPRWPIISKLLIGSLVLHVICAASVLYVPGLRSAFNLASLVAGTRIVEKDYEKTQIGDDVQLIELASDKFHYPDGYFAPEGQLPAVVPSPTPFVPPFVAQVQPPAVQPELGPPPSPTPVAAVPFSTPRVGASPATAIAQAKGSPSPTPVQSPALTAEQAQTELDKVAEKNNLTLPKENEINKKAMKDFAIYANDLKKQGKLDFNQPFEIIIEA